MLLATMPSDVSFCLQRAIFCMAICTASEESKRCFSNKEGWYQKSVGIALIARCILWILCNSLSCSLSLAILASFTYLRDYLLTARKNNFIGTPKKIESFPPGIKQGSRVNKTSKNLPINAFCLSCPFSPKTKKNPTKPLCICSINRADQSINHLPGFILSIQNIIVLRPLPFYGLLCTGNKMKLCKQTIGFIQLHTLYKSRSSQRLEVKTICIWFKSYFSNYYQTFKKNAHYIYAKIQIHLLKSRCLGYR